jgi:uncharacterized protein Veg
VANRETLDEIKSCIKSYIGEEVSLVTDRGKRKMKTKHGVIERVFDNIFTVEITEGFNSTRTVSYSYSDVLTDTVEVIIDETDVNIREEEIEIS